MSHLARQPLGTPQESLGLAKGCLALFELLLQTQESPGIFEQPAATLPARRQPSVVDGLDLGTRELLSDNLIGEPMADGAVDPGQRNQRFHRRLSGDTAVADRLLDTQRKLVHQAQKPRHPARALEETLGQLVLTPAEAMLQLGQQPPLLEGTRARAVGHLPPQDQRLGLLHLPHHRLHRVAAQAAKGRDALMAINDHVATWRFALGDHHDRLLLAVLFQAQP